MCGIVGTLSFHGSAFQVTEPYLVRMRDKMAHRGPDGAGLWISQDKRVGLGHRRLSIVDLSDTAAQPMCNEDGSLWITFNGEIYNHAEIRKELEALGGHRWRTDHSDTEVILHAFEQWGIDCVHRFRGMFAFALWDARAEHLWLVRDRIGVKPLYYSIHHGRMTFASEIKALLEDPDQERKVNEEGLYHYLTFLTTPAPKTLFAGISKLSPGTWIRVDSDGNILTRCYWDVLDYAGPLEERDEGSVAERILEELRAAVRLRKVSDVPVGVFLSGGIDSSTNAALFSEDATGPIRTFTIGYDADYASYRNETEYARLMAKTIGSEHHELLLSVDHLTDFLPRMVELQDEPIGDPVCVPVYYVSKLARDNDTIVCQVGEGADELFLGYPSWKLRLQLAKVNRLPVPNFARRGVLAGLRVVGDPLSRPFEALERASIGQPIFWGGVDVFTDTFKRRLLSERMRQRFKGFSSWEAIAPIHRRFRERAWEPSEVNWMTYVDLRLRLPELLLMRVDKMSMGASLEGRVPFLDHKFVELALSVPENIKVRHGTLKYILKRAVRPLVPRELINRKKQGFGVPVHEWFMGKLGVWARKELDDFCAQTDFFDRAEVEQLVEFGYGAASWYLLNFALWWKQYIA